MSSNHPYSSVENEFWYNVSPQFEMPIAGEITDRFDADRLATFLGKFDDLTDLDKVRSTVCASLIEDSDIYNDIRKLLALSDKRSYLDLSYLASRLPLPSKPDISLSGCYSWELQKKPLQFFLTKLRSKDVAIQEAFGTLIFDYLNGQGLLACLELFRGMSSEKLKLLYQVIIQSRENQQKAAKRRGHGCEAALANIINFLGIPLLPQDKAINPMGAQDPNLDRETLQVIKKRKGHSFSFDMIIPYDNDPLVAIQSLIHTSDPGQYGVNKSDETVAIAEIFKTRNQASASNRKKIELWGLVDGVGFCENKVDTINKMLAHFDCFIQLKTLYKAALKLHSMNLCKVAAIQFTSEYNSKDIEYITDKYVPKDVEVLTNEKPIQSDRRIITAGRATIILD